MNSQRDSSPGCITAHTPAPPSTSMRECDQTHNAPNRGSTPAPVDISHKKKVLTYLGNWAAALHGAIHSSISSFLSFGIHKLFRRFFAYREKVEDVLCDDVEARLPYQNEAPSADSGNVVDRIGNGTPNTSYTQFLRLGQDQWHAIISQTLVVQWTASCKGCVLVLYLSLGLLQIGDTGGNVYTRTTVLAAFICSGMGLMTGVGFLYADGYFLSDAFREKWIKASKDAHTGSADNFWMCLSLPISLLAWSTLFLMISVLFIICIIDNPILQAEISANLIKRDSDASSSKIYWISSMAFLLCLVVVHVMQAYRAGKLVLVQ